MIIGERIKMLSIIIPSYNESGNVINTADVVSKLMDDNNIPFELIFVDDGSKDDTWEKLTELSTERNYVNAVKFSRNFGKESAIFAGIQECDGDCCVVMDCDLQHPPEIIIEMYNIWKNNDVEVVEARKKNRGKESLVYKAFSKMFYRIIESSSGLDMRNTSDFKLLDRKAIDALNAMPERLTFFRALSSWVGFKTEIIEFEVAPRFDGETKWSFKSLFKYAINSITSFTSLPMQVVTFFGVIFFIIAVIMGIQTLYNKIWGGSVEGFSTVILLQLLTGSIIMFSLGIIGYYLSKIYEEIKFRPRFIISTRTKVNKELKNQDK